MKAPRLNAAVPRGGSLSVPLGLSVSFHNATPSFYAPLHVTSRRLTCRIIESKTPGTMKAQPHPSDREVLAGVVERVTYQNSENGFCVIRVKARSHRDLVTVVGHAATIVAGEWITASGDWVNDRTHGQQFKAQFLKTSEPTTIEGIEKYLASGSEFNRSTQHFISDGKRRS